MDLLFIIIYIYILVIYNFIVYKEDVTFYFAKKKNNIHNNKRLN